MGSSQSTPVSNNEAKEIAITPNECRDYIIDTSKYIHRLTEGDMDIEVHEPVGSGKTTILLKQIIETYLDYTADTISIEKHVIILEPTCNLVESTQKSLQEIRFPVGISHSKRQIDSSIVVMTYGKFISDLIKKTTSYRMLDIIICDEYHTIDANVQFVVEMLRQSSRFKDKVKIFMSATPYGNVIPRVSNYRLNTYNIRPNGPMYRINNDGLYFYGNYILSSDYSEGAVVHCPTIKQTDTLCQSWSKISQVPAYTLTSKTTQEEYITIMNSLPRAIIFATDTIRSGVNLNIESIILPGSSSKPHYTFTEDSSGIVKIDRTMKITNETIASNHQFECRVGRSRDGKAYIANIEYAPYNRWTGCEIRSALLMEYFDVKIPSDFPIKIVGLSKNQIRRIIDTSGSLNTRLDQTCLISSGSLNISADEIIVNRLNELNCLRFS